MPTNAHALLAEGARALPGPEARHEVALLLAHAISVSPTWLIAHADQPIAPRRVAAFRALVRRRARGEPVAYLMGSRGFHELVLRVTPDVLIPRPETELLVELALQRVPRDTACRVADLGTGSGAIALAIANARPRTRVVATDASARALRVARRNAGRLGLQNVEFVRGDWCAAIGDAGFYVIASNPPYVAAGDPHLDAGDLRFEPRAALVSGADGLDAICSIVRTAAVHLRADGWLLLEHGFEQGRAVRELLELHRYRETFTARDLAGRERVSGGRATL